MILPGSFGAYREDGQIRQGMATIGLCQSPHPDRPLDTLNRECVPEFAWTVKRMPVPEERPARHWLLPHERWLGRFLGRFAGRRADPPSDSRWRFQENYGPEGDAFLAAATADVVAAVILLFTGVILLEISADRGTLAAAGYWLLGLGILSGLVGVLRSIQLGHAGRVFRAGRPFITPGAARRSRPGR